jgi:hypothetical protein
MQLPAKINALNELKREAAVTTFKELLVKSLFAEDVASWFCANLQLIDE